MKRLLYLMMMVSGVALADASVRVVPRSVPMSALGGDAINFATTNLIPANVYQGSCLNCGSLNMSAQSASSFQGQTGTASAYANASAGTGKLLIGAKPGSILNVMMYGSISEAAIDRFPSDWHISVNPTPDMTLINVYLPPIAQGQGCFRIRTQQGSSGLLCVQPDQSAPASVVTLRF